MLSDIRWKQRFQNFERAFLLLSEALQNPLVELSDLEKEGIVQRFEYTFELAWKTVKDYLIFNGIVFDQVTPRHVLKQAFASKIIEDGQIWMDMLEHRNLMSHTYDRGICEKAVEAIAERYLTALEQFYTFFKNKNRIELIPIQSPREMRGFLKGIDTAIERESDHV